MEFYKIEEGKSRYSFYWKFQGLKKWKRGENALNLIFSCRGVE